MLSVNHGLKQLMRQHPREQSKIEGVFRKLVPEDINGQTIIIDDISMGGVRFRTTDPNIFMLSEIIEIEFKLNDGAMTLINRKVMITHLTGNQAGGEFIETDDSYHKMSSEAIEEFLIRHKSL